MVRFGSDKKLQTGPLVCCHSAGRSKRQTTPLNLPVLPFFFTCLVRTSSTPRNLYTTQIWNTKRREKLWQNSKKNLMFVLQFGLFQTTFFWSWGLGKDCKKTFSQKLDGSPNVSWIWVPSWPPFCTSRLVDGENQSFAKDGPYIPIDRQVYTFHSQSGEIDKAPRLSISIVIWILSSDTICQLN